MTTMVKEVVVLWTAALLAAASAEILVNASNTLLSTIPATYDANIARLILQHNRIAMNSSDIQALKSYSNLTELDLSHNHIAQLPDGAFSALSSLETLRLTGNKLQTIKNETFANLKKLKTLDLGLNPWNCTQKLVTLVKWMNDGFRLKTGPNVTCTTPRNLTGKNIWDVLETLQTQLPRTTSNAATARETTSTPSTVTAFTKTFMTVQSPRRPEPNTLSGHNISSKDTLPEAEQNGKPGANTWKFLTGVIMIILCTSMFIICAVKSPIWYKMLFDYRHQRLRETEEPTIFSTGRYSNYSLDTEQTETSAHELDQGFPGSPEDEDGFIEDGYIQPEDYKEQADVGEV